MKYLNPSLPCLWPSLSRGRLSGGRENDTKRKIYVGKIVADCENHWKKASGCAHKPVSGRSEPLLWLNLISKERSLSQSRVGALHLCLVGGGVEVGEASGRGGDKRSAGPGAAERLRMVTFVGGDVN